MSISNKLLISLVAIIFLTGGVFIWANKKGNEASTQAIPVYVETNRNDSVSSTDTSHWSIFRSKEYGFEVQTPDKLDPISYKGTTGTASGKNYETLQIAMGEPDINIKVILNMQDPTRDPYGSSPYATLPQVILNGITWHVFYEPKGGIPECDSASFQTLTQNGRDVLQISFFNGEHCPGNAQESKGVNFLKQVLSTFRFIE